MLFDDESDYYVADNAQYYQQGDIVLAPVAELRVGSRDGVIDVAGAPAVGDAVERAIWAPSAEVPASPGLAVSARLLPAMITTHDCALDKEFNRRVEQLRRGGTTQLKVAVEQAAADPNLDRLINVAPIVPLEDAAPSGRRELTENRVVGYFPVCESANRFLDVGVVDLLHETTIDRGLIVDRLAVISSAARSALRYALARFWVYRAPKIGFELEHAIGKRIRDVQISDDGALAIELVLSDGARLAFVQGPTVADPGPGRPSL